MWGGLIEPSNTGQLSVWAWSREHQHFRNGAFVSSVEEGVIDDRGELGTKDRAKERTPEPVVTNEEGFR